MCISICDPLMSGSILYNLVLKIHLSSYAPPPLLFMHLQLSVFNLSISHFSHLQNKSKVVWKSEEKKCKIVTIFQISLKVSELSEFFFSSC